MNAHGNHVSEKSEENVARFSKDDPDIPASEETKQKLVELTHANTEDGSLELPQWEAARNGLTAAALLGGLLELADYSVGAPAPGIGSEVGVLLGSALGAGGIIEPYTLVKKGAEKLRALITKNKPTGAEVPQSSQSQIGDNKT